ncbi:MAG: hypothetical protein ACYTGZ_21770 [Planctomycetota bacterium]|jgi:hypothetical protein
MPADPIPRVLFYVAVLFGLCLASTFPLWAAATIARTEYRSLMSSLACSMRIFFYAVCLLCILVALQSFNISPSDPRDPLFGWIQIGGTIWIVFPSGWRAFRQKGPRMAVCGVLAIVFSGALFAFGAWVSPAFRAILADMPYVLTKP